VAAQHTITIGTDPLMKPASLVFGRVHDATLTSAMPLALLSVAEWLDIDATPDVITAPWIGSLVTRGSKIAGGPTGDFEASLTLDGAGATKGTLAKAAIVGSLRGATWNLAGNLSALASLAVKGWVEDTDILVNGPVGKVAFGGMSGSSLLVGVIGTSLPDDAADFSPTHRILSSFTLTGIYNAARVLQTSFIDSDVAAWTLGKAAVKQVETRNGGTAFGFAAQTFGSLACQQGATKYTWPLLWPVDTGDFVVRDFT